MLVQWIQQEVERYSSWSKRCWRSQPTSDELPTDFGQLDRMLDQSKASSKTSLINTSILKHDRTTTVAKVEIKNQCLVLKRYNARSKGHVFSRAFRRSRASRSWQMSYAFANAGLNVAAPRLMLEQRSGPLRFTAYFASEYLLGEELLTKLPSMPADQQQQVLVNMRAAFKAMQSAKLTHGDLKASNIIWLSGELYFIDLDAAQRHRTAMSWNFSHEKDKQRFLKNWRKSPELEKLFAEL